MPGASPLLVPALQLVRLVLVHIPAVQTPALTTRIIMILFQLPALLLATAMLRMVFQSTAMQESALKMVVGVWR